MKHLVNYFVFVLLLSAKTFSMEHQSDLKELATREIMKIVSQETLNQAVLEEFKLIVKDYNNRKERAAADYHELEQSFWYANDYFDALKTLAEAGNMTAAAKLTEFKENDYFLVGYTDSEELSLPKELQNGTYHTYYLKKGARLSAAISNFGQKVIFIDCGMAYQLAFYKALLRYFGPTMLDEIFEQFRDRPVLSASSVYQTMLDQFCTAAEYTEIPGPIGTVYSMRNHVLYSRKERSGEAQNINLVVLENDGINEPKLLGLGLPDDGLTKSEIAAFLVSEFNRKPYNSATLSQKTWDSRMPTALYLKVFDLLADETIKSVDDQDIYIRLAVKLIASYNHDVVQSFFMHIRSEFFKKENQAVLPRLSFSMIESLEKQALKKNERASKKKQRRLRKKANHESLRSMNSWIE